MRLCDGELRLARSGFSGEVAGVEEDELRRWLMRLRLFLAVVWTRVSAVMCQQWAGFGAGTVLQLLCPIAAATPLRCGRNAVLLRVFLVIWIHRAIAAGCGSGPCRNRNIEAASVDAVRNLNHYNINH